MIAVPPAATDDVYPSDPGARYRRLVEAAVGRLGRYGIQEPAIRRLEQRGGEGSRKLSYNPDGGNSRTARAFSCPPRSVCGP